MKKISLAILSATAILLGTGCQKDNTNNLSKGVGFADASGTVSNRSVLLSSTPASVVMTQIKLSSTATEDLHINLIANPTLIANFNADPVNTTKLDILPAGLYSLPPLKITILKGTDMGALNMTIPNPSMVDASKLYGFGYSIASVDEPGYTIAANQRELLVVLRLQNAYEGDYLSSGYFFHLTAPRPLANSLKRIYTINATSSYTGVADTAVSGSFFHFDVSPQNTLGNWGLHGINISSPFAGGFFNTDNPGGYSYLPIMPGTGQWVHATYNNTYDPTTRTFWMHYGFSGGTPTGPSGWNRQVYERLVKQ